MSQYHKLYTPQDSAIVFIDHQPQMTFGVANIDRSTLINNVTLIAKVAKEFNVPAVLTAVETESFSGYLWPQLLDVFPGQPVVERSSMNSWDDPGFRKAIEATGRKNIIMTGLWTEVCVTWPTIEMLGAGYNVYVVDDCCGATSQAAHDAALSRMVQAGAVRLTTIAALLEWQRDWMKTTAAELNIRRADERGHADHGWLNSHHTFSFADYYDPAHMGFRSLRVINDDRVAPGMGFGTHPHRDMEIFSYVLEGTLEHKDSMGNGRQLKPGQIQLMSAGRGITHSEYNPSHTEPLHFLQIWIQPRERGLTPSYTEWHPKPEQADAAKVLVISPDGRDGSATIHQDADIYRIRLRPGQTVTHKLKEGRGAWLHVAEGALTLNGVTLTTGDGTSTEEPGTLALTATKQTEAILFDLN